MSHVERIKVRGTTLRAAVESLGHDPDNATKTQVKAAERVAARMQAAKEVQIPINRGGLDYLISRGGRPV